MNRYYICPADWNEANLAIRGEEAKHCVRVMRTQVGQQVEVFDGEGKSAVCTVLKTSKSEVALQLDQLRDDPQPASEMVLYQAVPKSGNMELIVQKAVELGVASIQPLITEHTVARADAIAKKQAKWQRIALEACKQCGQNRLPQILPTLGFASWLAEHQAGELAIIAAISDQSQPLKQVVEAWSGKGKVAILVGPEGDFSSHEYAAAFAAGFTPISLGEIILRVETATMFCLSVVRNEQLSRA